MRRGTFAEIEVDKCVRIVDGGRSGAKLFHASALAAYVGPDLIPYE